MAKQPESRPGVDDVSGQHIWTWDTSFGTTSVYHVACLSGATFHLRLSILTAWGRNKIVRALQDGVPPETAIPGKRVEISLESIRQLRYSEEAGVLEIHFGAKAPAALECHGTSVGREIYAALRERIAPGVVPTTGELSVGYAITAPVIGLFATALFGGLAIWNSTVEVVPGVHRIIVLKNIAPNAGVKVWIHAILAWIGTANLVAIVLAVAACFAWWLYCRRSHRHRAEVTVCDGTQ